MGMTSDELAALPAVVDVPTAGRALGIGSTLAYALVKAGEFPCPVLRLGRLYRVPRAGLLEVLGLVPNTREADVPPTSAPALPAPAAACTPPLRST